MDAGKVNDDIVLPGRGETAVRIGSMNVDAGKVNRGALLFRGNPPESGYSDYGGNQNHTKQRKDRNRYDLANVFRTAVRIF